MSSNAVLAEAATVIKVGAESGTGPSVLPSPGSRLLFVIGPASLEDRII